MKTRTRTLTELFDGATRSKEDLDEISQWIEATPEEP